MEKRQLQKKLKNVAMVTKDLEGVLDAQLVSYSLSLSLSLSLIHTNMKKTSS